MEESIFAIDNFVAVRSGGAIRLLPFGVLVKNGVKREITPEIAKKFRLPHFKPAIKLGSHDDATPAGGFIVGLEVGPDGLYALTEWTEKGLKAWHDGDYRYQSPEILWGGGIEDPETGEKMSGPMIVGTALLHTPHLGERAALYTIELKGEGDEMTDQVTVPVSWLDKLLDRFAAKREDAPEPAPATQVEPAPSGVDVEKFAALEKERDDLTARLQALEAEKEKDEKFSALTTELQDAEKFGAVFSGDAAKDAAEVLIGMTDDQRGWVMQRLSALVAQVKESNLTGEVGSSGDGEDADPYSALERAVKAEMEAAKVNYNTALDNVAAKRPELIEKVYPRKRAG